MLAFLLSPIGRMIASGLGILVVAGGIYAKGRYDGREACEQRVERAVAAEQKRQSDAFATALAAANSQAAKTETENANLQDMVTKYENSLAQRTDACLLAPDDAGSLSGIR